MSTVESEITALEERLRRAELGTDPSVFEELLDDDAVLVSQAGPSFTKAQIVEAHQPGAGPKFMNVVMSELEINDHGIAAVVTCKGTYEKPQSTMALRFMRVWLKKNGRWQIIASSISE